ncbi:hypothetical protein M9H77_16669 [Catharanthus roseus]|uniref:Uncharacterized protein n=1 Tax=Catharanthus roseus TaxID=4058 RepID=A0ACC0B2G8_CATRO|nr:hypothetical protein M9H77_16669 [Catharanthus roseus]
MKFELSDLSLIPTDGIGVPLEASAFLLITRLSLMNKFEGFDEEGQASNNLDVKRSNFCEVLDLPPTVGPTPTATGRLLVELDCEDNTLPRLEGCIIPSSVGFEKDMNFSSKEKESEPEKSEIVKENECFIEKQESDQKRAKRKRDSNLKIQAMMKKESVPTIVSYTSKYVSSYDPLKNQLVNNDVSGEPSYFGCELVHDDSFFDIKVGDFLEFNCASFVVFHEKFKERIIQRNNLDVRRSKFYEVFDLLPMVGPASTVTGRFLAELDF